MSKELPQYLKQALTECRASVVGCVARFCKDNEAAVDAVHFVVEELANATENERKRRNLTEIPSREIHKLWIKISIDRLKDRRKRDSKYRSLEDSQSANPQYQISPLDKLIAREDIDRVRNALSEINMRNPRWFDLLDMGFFKGLSRKDMATEMGMHPTSVTKMLQRAMNALRELLEECPQGS